MKLSLLCSFVFAFQFGIFSQTMKDFKSIEGIDKNNFPKDSASIVKWIAHANELKTGNPDSAEILLKVAYHAATLYKLPYFLPKIYDRYGIVLKNKSLYKEAIEVYYEGVNAAQKYHQPRILASLYNNIANIFHRLNELDKALNYYYLALKISKQNNFNDAFSITYANISGIYFTQNKIQESIRYIKKAIQIDFQNRDTLGLSFDYHNLSNIFTAQAQYDSARKYLEKSLILSKNLNDRVNYANHLSTLSKVELAAGNKKLALELLKEAENKTLKSKNILNLSAIYNSLAAIYDSLGQYTDALNYQKKYKVLSDSIFALEKYKVINDLEKKYASRKYETQILKLQNENLKKESKFIFRKKVIIIMTALMMVAIAIAFSFYKTWQKRKKLGLQLNEKLKELELKQQELQQLNLQLTNNQTALKIENSEALFEILKQQLNPHFLFNTLSTLSTLIMINNEKAYLFLQSLYHLFKKLTNSASRTLVSVKEELTWVNEYIYLLSVRFNNQIEIVIQIPERYQSYKVPPFSLQILIENAIKHNEISQKKPMKIFISGINDLIEVKNIKQKKKSASESTGLGLKNLENRYKLLKTKLPVVIDNDDTFTVQIPLIN
jgi:sensor histidine kinase YesM